MSRHGQKKKVYKWLINVDWENLGSYHAAIEFIVGMHAICVEYRSE
jgi:hypothetical protein